MVGKPVGETGEGEVAVGEGTDAGEGEGDWPKVEVVRKPIGKKKTMLEDMVDIW